MITSIERIGTEENHEGWFLINKHVQVRFVQDDSGEVVSKIQFDHKIITEQEAQEIVQELLCEVFNRDVYLG